MNLVISGTTRPHYGQSRLPSSPEIAHPRGKDILFPVGQRKQFDMPTICNALDHFEFHLHLSNEEKPKVMTSSIPETQEMQEFSVNL